MVRVRFRTTRLGAVGPVRPPVASVTAQWTRTVQRVPRRAGRFCRKVLVAHCVQMGLSLILALRCARSATAVVRRAVELELTVVSRVSVVAGCMMGRALATVRVGPLLLERCASRATPAVPRAATPTPPVVRRVPMAF